ncbi:acetyl-CoA synthetase [Halobaculum lipolyticum]|uniref:Acetyl-CoA synthetase n=1 Tax=Halobaculum lipolyticum TaxID=3032001 RepID=A0ABD5WAA4_9EURY|nr:acetyl-CoA synthetase [Halobaculum sp. DT31]
MATDADLDDPSLVGDLVARERRSERLALSAAELDRTYSYFDLCNTACKVGNVLSHRGVREGDRLVVDPVPLPEPVLTFLGAALLGAVTEFDADPGRECDARAVVVPVDREPEFDLPGGSKLLCFGGDPERPATTHWEQEVWSENPAFPPTFHDPADPVLRDPDADRAYSHAALLDAARAAADALALDGDSRVAVRAPLSDPRTVAAGVLAPLLVGGAVSLPDGDASPDATAAVATDAASAVEERVLALEAVSL